MGLRGTAALASGTVAVAALLGGCGAPAHGVSVTVGGGPQRRFDCTYDAATEALTGADGTASAIGWAGNHQGVVTCLGGTFFVQNGIDRNFGFGIYDGSPTTWTDAQGYLPAQVTTFSRSGATVAITEFADKVTLGGHPYVAVYCRVAVTDPTGHPITADPDPSSGLVALDAASDTVPAHGTVDHDYVVAVDRFGGDDPWPTAEALAGAGGYDRHFAHMRAFWNEQLDGIATVELPDRSLDDAYRSGFIETQIARSGDHLDTGVNGYEMEFNHDVIGILTDLFTEGYDTGAHDLLLDARNVVGTQGQYADGTWTYAWPWAVYLMKTGDLAFVKKNFSSEGPLGSAQPSIEDTAHAIASDRTGPGGIMASTDDIDTNGYWTVDDYEALIGLAAYHYLAVRVGDTTEALWAAAQYASLLAATTATLQSTMTRYGLTYLPCSILEPNTADRCDNPEDANWASPLELGKWAWEAQTFGAPVSGPGSALIDATYDYGFGRLAGLLPPDTFGGFPSDYYSSAYNAGYGAAGLASQDHRDQGILSYEFMIADSQSGPNSWWESAGPPAPDSPWVGSHPATGQGSSPHAWGMAQANQVLLDSLVAPRSDGSLVVGRGLPGQWLTSGSSISVANFPTADGRRLGVRITSTGTAVTLALSGAPPSGPVLFQAPAFTDDVAAATAGTVDEPTGTVTLPAGVRTVTVELRSAPAG